MLFRSGVSSKPPPADGGPTWTHFGNAVSLLFLPAATSTERGGRVRGGSGTLIALTVARGSASGGGQDRFQVEVPILRRSRDGGASWGPEILPLGEPRRGDRWLPVQQVYDARNGRLLLTLGNGTEPIPRVSTCESHGIVQLASVDGGLHWSAVVDISAGLSGETTCLAPTGGVGIQLREGSPWAGRILWAMLRAPKLQNGAWSTARTRSSVLCKIQK